MLRAIIVVASVTALLLGASDAWAQPAAGSDAKPKAAPAPTSQPTSAPAVRTPPPPPPPRATAAPAPDVADEPPAAVGDDEGGDDLFADAPEAMETEKAEEDPKERLPFFVLNGYLQGQVGLFTDTSTGNKQLVDEDGDEYWVDHGGLGGELSMFRGTLQLEGDLNPSKYASLHFVFRGVRSLKLEADRVHAEPPDGRFAGDPVDWVHDTYYTEEDLRELYLDVNPNPWLSFRVGRQQVPWGDLGQYRLLDVINPTDSTWHFGTLESYEDTRIPLWIFKSQVELKPLAGALEFVWVPMLDRPEDTVTVPLTFTGAWGLPLAGPREFKSSFDIKRKICEYPGRDIEDSRLGARWIGALGDLSYTLVYYWGHQLSPPVPTGFYQRFVEEMGAIEDEVEVILEFPRQHITGFSLEYMFKEPVSTVFRLEASYTPNAYYAGASVPAGELVSEDYVQGEDLYTALPYFEKQVVSYGIQVMRPTFLRFLNRDQTFMLVGQVLHTIILDFDDAERMVSVPGFDSTATKQHSLTIVGAVVTNYLHGMLQPKILGAYIPNENAHSGFLTAGCGIVLGNSLRMAVAWTNFFGQDPYKGVGLFRDRDEVSLRVRYQF